MAQRVPSPFNSPFAKAILAILWVAYTGMGISLVRNYDTGLLFMLIGWTGFLPLFTWFFLSGVRLEPARSVGGGPMYPRVNLEPGEEVQFAGPTWGVQNAHVFVTSARLITLPMRGYGAPRSIPFAAMNGARPESRRFDWSLSGQVARVNHTGGSLVLRPYCGPALMGMVDDREFVSGIMDVLRKAGVPIESDPPRS